MALPQQQQQQLQGRQRRRFRQTEWGRQSALDRKSVSGRFGAAWNRGRGATPKGKKERRGLILQCPRCSRAETLHLENSTNDIFGVRNTQKRREIDDYTMKLLDWVNICSHVSIFTSTKLGNEECYNMVIGSDIEESLVSICIYSTWPLHLSRAGINSFSSSSSSCSFYNKSNGVCVLLFSSIFLANGFG